jgi:hypothetical protein
MHLKRSQYLDINMWMVSFKGPLQKVVATIRTKQEPAETCDRTTYEDTSSNWD